MASFDKSAVDVAELSPSELSRVVSAMGFDQELRASRKLTNGGCAANYVVEVGAQKVMIKAIVGSSAEEVASLAGDHLRVLQVLTPPAAPTAVPPGQTPVPCKTTSDAPAMALGMSFLEGEAANRLLRDGKVEGPAVFAALGSALATVHAAPPPEGLCNVNSRDYFERYVRCEAPLEDRIAEWKLKDTFSFIDWLEARLPSVRGAHAHWTRKGFLPGGLLHGDPFIDNVLIVEHGDGKRAASLVDWEDSGVGPLVYDLAVAAIGGCFKTETAEGDRPPSDIRAAPLKLAELDALLGSYSAIRPLSFDEAAGLPPLMTFNAVMCACYRWYSFHIMQPDAPDAAKGAHLEIVAVVHALEDESINQQIVATARKHVTPPPDPAA